MAEYVVRFTIVVDAETEEEATEQARELVSNPRFEPVSVTSDEVTEIRYAAND